jgi:hypothetical protein
MNRWAAAMTLAAGTIPAFVAWATLLGLGAHRHASPIAVAAIATVLVFVPPVFAGALGGKRRFALLGLALGLWSIGVMSALPVYFPGERRDAIITGLATLAGDGLSPWARAMADEFPGEPGLSEPALPEATALVEAVVTPAAPVDRSQIVLPYEGEGRRLSVPVVFEQGGKTREVEMLLDTGATYTTLPSELIEALGIPSPADAPVVRLHTANGERDAKMVMVDRLWLGDLALDHVTIATCEACAGTGTVGLLGLNVSGNFNLTIDADRREVTFTTRSETNRRLDASPFSEVGASVSRFAGGRIEVAVTIENKALFDLREAAAEVKCGEQTWVVDVGDVPAGGTNTAGRRLPVHAGCERYLVGLHRARW